MDNIQRIHYYLHHESCDECLIKVVIDSGSYNPFNHTTDVLIKAIYRLYEQEKGVENDGLIGEVA